MKAAESNTIFTEELYDLRYETVVAIPKELQSLTVDQIQLLTKILASVKLSIDGITILQIPEVNLEKLSVLKTKRILSFGCTPLKNISYYTLETINGIKVIQADALSELDDNRKKSLWNALKQGF